LLAYLLENIAALPMRLVMAVPIAIAFVLAFGSVSLHPQAFNLLLVPISMVGAFLLTFLPMACIGTLSLFWESSIAAYDVWLGMYTVFSGYVMPLELFPGTLGRIVKYLPFRQCLAFPVENAIGLLSPHDALRDLTLQWAWIAFFTCLAHVLWRVGVRRFGAYGG